MNETLTYLLIALGVQLVASLIPAIRYLGSHTYDGTTESGRPLIAPLGLVAATAFWTGLLIALTDSQLWSPLIFAAVVLFIALDLANGISVYGMGKKIPLLQLVDRITSFIAAAVICMLGFWWFLLALFAVMALVQITTLMLAKASRSGSRAVL